MLFFDPISKASTLSGAKVAPTFTSGGAGGLIPPDL